MVQSGKRSEAGRNCRGNGHTGGKGKRNHENISRTVSLETPIGEEEDSHLGDFIPDDDAPAPAGSGSPYFTEGTVKRCS